MGIVHFSLFAHVIFDGDLSIQRPTNMAPETSARAVMRNY
jgi:hypothetical protein